MNRTWLDLLSSTRNSIARSLVIAAGACFALALGTASPMQAQTTYPVNGTAGFETGIQRIATVDSISDPTLDWGDGTSTRCPAIGAAFPDSCSLAVGGPIGTDVYGTHRYGLPGIYTISVSYVPFPFISKTVTTTATISPAGDFVILSIGDSIASGEGNPLVPADPSNQPNWGFWDDPYSVYPVSPFPADEAAEWPNQAFPCHRSSLAGPAQAMAVVQQNNPGVTFVHYACSGAKITAGDTDNPYVQDAIGQLRVARGRLPRIDVLIISIGSNSLYGPDENSTSPSFGDGFGALFSYCLPVSHIGSYVPCRQQNTVISDLDNSFKNILPGGYKKLVKEINCINPDGGTREPSCTDPQKQTPKLVLITEYMDPTHDGDGQYPSSCPIGFTGLTQDDWRFFHDSVVQPLNDQVHEFPVYAAQAGLSVPTYAVTGIADDFRNHGICAGSQRWVNTIYDSLTTLGLGSPPLPHLPIEPDDPTPLVPPKAAENGSGHPNSSALGFKCSPRCGQEDYRDRIYAAVVNYNPPITTPSAITNGQPYAFGTWTTHNATISLSAVNAISQAGVRATFYAVDNAQCSSANAAGCLTYGGPFMITTSGKHSVTFFSENAQGFPEATQSVQVWVDNEPPVMTCTATPSVLWPPNNKMVPVRLGVTAISAAFGPTPFSLKSVATSEGNAATDIHGFVIGQPSTAGSLLASRLGNEKTGRVYTFVYQSTDELGLTGTCTAKVLVPHDQARSHP